MDLNVALPFASSLLSFVFAIFLLDQWRERRRPYQLVWMIGMLWYAISAGTEFIGGAFGWSEPLYRVWYLVGAIWVAAWLGLGTVLLLARTRFGNAFAVSLGLAGLFTYLSWAKYQHPDSGAAPYIGASLAGAIYALLRGRLNSRVPATILIAIGGLIPAITSGANRFGATSAFFVGEFLGVLFLFTGFLVSVEVFREIRVPFSRIVLRVRRAEA